MKMLLICWCNRTYFYYPCRIHLYHCLCPDSDFIILNSSESPRGQTQNSIRRIPLITPWHLILVAVGWEQGYLTGIAFETLLHKNMPKVTILICYYFIPASSWYFMVYYRAKIMLWWLLWPTCLWVSYLSLNYTNLYL